MGGTQVKTERVVETGVVLTLSHQERSYLRSLVYQNTTEFTGGARDFANKLYEELEPAEDHK
jgi:hypothetical protein